MKPATPGEPVQVDTLSINLRPDKAIKQFTAYDPVARFTAAKAFSTASAGCAKAQACKDKGLALFLLPPKRPDLNGAVERAQGSWRYEFYACDDLPHRLNRLNEHTTAPTVAGKPHTSISPARAKRSRRLKCTAGSPGTARSSIAAGRSLIETRSVICPRLSPFRLARLDR